MKVQTSKTLLFALIIPFFALSQVGIGTTTPNAQLEIKSTNQATPNNTDGILIPKVDEFPVTAPTASQDGMMVFVTGSGTPIKGFYYWNNATTTWMSFTATGAEKIDDLTDGKSDSDGTNNGSSIFLGINSGLNDDGTDNQNTSLGFNSLTNNTSGFSNTGIGSLALWVNTIGYQNTAIGNYSLFDNSVGINNVGIGTAALGDNTIGNNNTAIGALVARNTGGDQNVYIGTNAGNGGPFGTNRSGSVFIGYLAGFGESDSNKLFIENSISATPLIYGEFDNDIVRINGEFQINNPSSGGYNLPTVDGIANQVMQTNGSGNVNWVDTSALDDGDWVTVGVDIERQSGDVYIGDTAGTNNNLYLSGLLYDWDTTSYYLNPGNLNVMNEIQFDNGAVNNPKIRFADANTGFFRPVANEIALTISSTQRFRVRSNGRVSFGDEGTHFDFPLARGTANQVMRTDGAGNVDWVNVTSFGSEKIDDLTDGKTNTASNSIYLGVNAGTATTDTNTGNISLGRNTLSSLATGNNNVAIGDLALEDITNGGANVAIGNYAMTNRTSGSSNTATGSHSQFFNTTGTENSSLGLRALYGNNGDFNTAVGAHAGHSSSSGSNNVFVGYSAGYNETGNNKLYIENTNADANNALIYGEFDTNLLRVNGDFQVNNSGRLEIQTNTDASGTSGTGSLEIGGSLRLDGNEIITNTNGVLFVQHDNNGDFRVDNTTFMVDASTNRIGILNTAPSTDVHLKQSDNLQGGGGGITFESALAAIDWKIYHSGSAISFAENGIRRAYITAGTGAYVQTSDRTLKKNISLLEGSMLDKLSEIEIYRYHYLDQNSSDEKTIGVMAQEIQLQFPELVSIGEDEKLGMNYAGLSVIAIKAIKEQQFQIEAQQLQIDELKLLVNQLLENKD